MEGGEEEEEVARVIRFLINFLWFLLLLSNFLLCIHLALEKAAAPKFKNYLNAT